MRRISIFTAIKNHYFTLKRLFPFRMDDIEYITILFAVYVNN